jgi:hypothetical protein
MCYYGLQVNVFRSSLNISYFNCSSFEQVWVQFFDFVNNCGSMHLKKNHNQRIASSSM